MPNPEKKNTPGQKNRTHKSKKHLVEIMTPLLLLSSVGSPAASAQEGTSAPELYSVETYCTDSDYATIRYEANNASAQYDSYFNATVHDVYSDIGRRNFIAAGDTVDSSISMNTTNIPPLLIDLEITWIGADDGNDLVQNFELESAGIDCPDNNKYPGDSIYSIPPGASEPIDGPAARELPELPSNISADIFGECVRKDNGEVDESANILIAASILNQSGQNAEFKLIPLSEESTFSESEWTALPTKDNVDNTVIFVDSGATSYPAQEVGILYRPVGSTDPTHAHIEPIPGVSACKNPEGLMGEDGNPLAVGDGQNYERTFGLSRFETAEQIAYTTFPDGANTVIIASSDVAADQLSGSPLARALEAPILVQPSSAEYDIIHPAVEQAIHELGAEEAILLGGEVAVSQNTQDLLVQMGLQVRRIDGATRYETAVAIAEELTAVTGNAPSGASQADGGNFADAITAAGASGNDPVLLTYGPEQSQLPTEVYDYLVEHESTIDNIRAVGEAAANVMGQASAAATANGEAIVNATPFETSIDVAAANLAQKGGQIQRIFVASADQFPDGLSAGVSIDVSSGDMLVVASDSDLDNMHALQDFLSIYGNPDASVHVIGGTAAVSDILASTIANTVASTAPSK